MLLMIFFGVLPAFAVEASCSHGPVEVECPKDPLGPDGRAVSDQFFFAHRPMGVDGSITVRMTSMTGTITYPPPDHDRIVPGLVPWAKAGIIVKDGLAQGSPYAALVMTGGHGVRMQHNYAHDTAGRPGSVSEQSPRWLRLTRSGDTITGEESSDGVQWARVGTVRLKGLSSAVQVGLFATSPGDITLRRVWLGATVGMSRFTQASAVFDNVTVLGSTAGEPTWNATVVGESGHTDWEKYHRAPGLVEDGGQLTVTGSGDIGPIGNHGVITLSTILIGLIPSLIVLIVVAARFGAAKSDAARLGAAETAKSDAARLDAAETAKSDAAEAARLGAAEAAKSGAAEAAQLGAAQAAKSDAARSDAAEAARFRAAKAGRSDATGAARDPRKVLPAQAVVVGAVTFLAGLAAAAVTVPAATRLLRANNVSVAPLDLLTEIRVIVGVAALLAAASVLALALGALLRRAWAAIAAAIAVIIVPYLFGIIPFLPEEVSDWLLRLTPAAGFAVLQTSQEYPQVTAHYAPYAGYFPLPGWAGFAVLCGYIAAAVWLNRARLGRRAAP